MSPLALNIALIYPGIARIMAYLEVNSVYLTSTQQRSSRYYDDRPVPFRNIYVHMKAFLYELSVEIIF